MLCGLVLFNVFVAVSVAARCICTGEPVLCVYLYHQVTMDAYNAVQNDHKMQVSRIMYNTLHYVCVTAARHSSVSSVVFYQYSVFDEWREGLSRRSKQLRNLCCSGGCVARERPKVDVDELIALLEELDGEESLSYNSLQRPLGR